ncbi:Protein HEXIM1 [Harpegnathos saltator]|uniref:Protein HEXIM1 n=2 Tax=Harpegnathos saltator TaxID=610380 RepID=E2BJY2_HARSA|nr:Protein HEXIM1 [Harpegnathos saltator]
METHRPERTREKVSGGGDGNTMGVTVKPMPAASSLPVPEPMLRPIGGNVNNVDDSYDNRPKNYLKALAETYARMESGSGSGDQDGGQHEDGVDIAAKKRRTRRGKPKHKKLRPYSRFFQREISSARFGRYIGRRAPKCCRHPRAPYNTTQFLMADHSDLPDLEQKLSEAASLEVHAMFQKPPARTRDSSFSVDSDEDYFYSSPEDEEEFLTKEFSTAYEDLHAERLNNLTKTQLIQEYLQLEAKVDGLSKRQRKNLHQVEEKDTENKTAENKKTDTEQIRTDTEQTQTDTEQIRADTEQIRTDTDTSKKLKLCQQRIDDLLQQNEQLRRENEILRTEKILRPTSSESSVDSESDSDSSNSNQSRCSFSLSSPGRTSMNAYKSRLDNNFKADGKEDSCDIDQNDSLKKCTTPTNLSNGHMIVSETKSCSV